MALVVQPFAWIWIMRQVPVVENRLDVPHYLLDHDPVRLLRFPVLSDASYERGGVLAIDVTSGQLSELPREYYLQTYPIAGNREKGILFTRLNYQDVRVEWIDSTSGKVLDCRDFDGIGFNVCVVNDRFLMMIQEDRVSIWDAENPDRPVLRVPNPAPGEKDFKALPGSNRIYCVQRTDATKTTNDTEIGDTADEWFSNPRVPSQPASYVGRAVLMQASMEGIEALASWDLIATEDRGFQSNPITRVDDMLVSIAPSADVLHYYSLADGMLVKQSPLPEGFDPHHETWSLEDGQLMVGPRVRGRALDLASNSWMPHPGPGYNWCWPGDRNGLALYHEEASDQYLIFDKQAGKSLMTVPASFGTPLLLDDQTFAMCSESDGFSVTKIDVKSGRIRQILQPLWWVAPSLLIIVLVYLAWLVAWLSFSTSAGLPAWLDSALIGGFPVGVMGWQFHAGNEFHNNQLFGYHLLQQVILGIACSGLFLLVCHAFLGPSRLVSRLNIGLLLLAAIGWLLCSLFIGSPVPLDDSGEIWILPSSDEAWYAILAMWPPCLAADDRFACVWCAMDFESIQDAAEKTQPADDQEESRTNWLTSKAAKWRILAQWRIVDVLLLTLAVALLINAFGPMVEHADS
jgi:hypothetical protein